jgi:hypothetical protein
MEALPLQKGSNYYAIQCPKCMKWSGTQINNIQKKVFTCVYCRKTAKLKYKQQYGLKLRLSGPYEVQQLPKTIQALNNKW